MKAAHRGVSLIEVLVVIAIIGILSGLLMAAIQRVRASAARLKCQSQMRQIVLALHQYHDTHRHLPPGLSVNVDRQRYLYLGWTARILPYIEQAALWEQIERAFATDPDPTQFYGHPAHLSILGTYIPLYVCPADGRIRGAVSVGRRQYGYTSYLGVAGLNHTTNEGVLFADSRISFHDVTDGLSNTIMIGERPPPTDLLFGWWYRGWGQNKTGSAEMLLGVREINILGNRYPCGEGPYYFQAGNLDNQCSMFHYWSLHSGGANFAAADGAVRFLSYQAEAYLPALASRAGGEAWSWPE
jgi:prepilin-type N-terminal cleavage/methylation domain-containing protein/prepilin-type processing-associated H-X9-DG protein